MHISNLKPNYLGGSGLQTAEVQLFTTPTCNTLFHGNRQLGVVKWR